MRDQNLRRLDQRLLLLLGVLLSRRAVLLGGGGGDDDQSLVDRRGLLRRSLVGVFDFRLLLRNTFRQSGTHKVGRRLSGSLCVVVVVFFVVARGPGELRVRDGDATGRHLGTRTEGNNSSSSEWSARARESDVKPMNFRTLSNFGSAQLFLRQLNKKTLNILALSFLPRV